MPDQPLDGFQWLPQTLYYTVKLWALFQVQPRDAITVSNLSKTGDPTPAGGGYIRVAGHFKTEPETGYPAARRRSLIRAIIDARIGDESSFAKVMPSNTKSKPHLEERRNVKIRFQHKGDEILGILIRRVVNNYHAEWCIRRHIRTKLLKERLRTGQLLGENYTVHTEEQTESSVRFGDTLKYPILCKQVGVMMPPGLLELQDATGSGAGQNPELRPVNDLLRRTTSTLPISSEGSEIFRMRVIGSTWELVNCRIEQMYDHPIPRKPLSEVQINKHETEQMRSGSFLGLLFSTNSGPLRRADEKVSGISGWLKQIILPKWNPTMENLDLNDELALTTNEEQEWNKEATDEDITVWDLNITLSNITDGFLL
ncbi:hypothetical protein B0H13DRAFT_1873926 [Mycena leptocephala]|nr:hypothetical protein B0H13DRAFT_1873926 [Mycena leptocephala]